MQPPLPPPPYASPGLIPAANAQPTQSQGYPIAGYPVPPPTGYAPLYPLPLPPYAYMGYAPPAPIKRHVPWWGQALALVLPPVVAWVIGWPVWGLFLWVTYGDSPTPPPNADHVAQWLTAAYIAVGVLWGLGIHAIVVRKPWFFLAGVVVTVGLLGGVVWAYVNLY